MTKAGSRFLFLLLLLALALPGMGQAASAQKPLDQRPAAERQLIAIKVTGSKRFPEEAIAASTGLQLGTPVGEDDFKKAARNLGDTGAFTDIGYSYTYSSAGTKLELKVTDTEKFVPARFEDFVWFTDAELLSRIKEHVPLFNGDLPLSGRMPDEVSDVLQAMLVEKAIPGHVDYVREGKQDGPVEWISFKVSEVLIRVRNIEFTGAGDDEKAALEAAAHRLQDREFSRSRLNLLVQRDLLPVYHARGYLKASFAAPQPKAVQVPSSETLEEGPRNQSVVDVTFAVTPGRQYKLKSLAWSGNHEFPAATLEKMVHIEVGQPANTVRLSDELKEVQKLYGTRGFVTATVEAEAEYDDAASTVTIGLEVKEGSQFHMGELEFRGLDNSLTAKLRDAWKLRQGDVYDASYLDQYLPTAHKLLPASLDWDVAPHVTANGRDKNVDVDLIYSVKAPK
jgi:outer membrane protein assembly factor BamA